MDHPAKVVANHARGQLKNGEHFFSVSPFAPENKSWPREVGSATPSRVNLLILHTQAEFGAYSRNSSRFSRWRPLVMRSAAIRSIPSLSVHAIAYRWRSPSRVHWHRASIDLKAVPSTGRVLSFQVSPWISFFFTSLFPNPLMVSSGHAW